MDTAPMTAPALARQLGVSLPRMHRLLDAEGAEPGAGRGHAREIDPGLEARLLRRIGSVPQRLDRLSRIDMLVLAVLSRSALGLQSVRAVARAAGVSPTAVGKSLELLEGRGLVHRSSRRLVQGRPRTIELWVANLTGHSWTPDVSEAVSRVTLPEPQMLDEKTSAALSKRVPARFAHLFWNADIASLDPDRDGDFIASRMMTADDPDAWAWAIGALSPNSLRKAAGLRGLNPRRRSLIANLASAAEGTLNGMLGGTKVQFLDASAQKMIDEPIAVAGLDVAQIRDLLAMKLKVIGDRGELRDYFDIECIERETSYRAEQGIAFYVERYRPRPPEPSVAHIVEGLGHFGDVADDPSLPESRESIERYWRRRQPQIAASLAKFGVPQSSL